LCKQSEIKLSGDGAGILSNFSIGNYKDTQIDAEWNNFLIWFIRPGIFEFRESGDTEKFGNNSGISSSKESAHL